MNKEEIYKNYPGPASYYITWESFKNKELNSILNLSSEKEKSIRNYLKQEYLESIPSDFKNNYDSIFNKWKDKIIKNNHKKPISIVIPSYKEEKFIESTLDSLFNQECIKKDDFEIFLVVNYPDDQVPNIQEYDDTGNQTLIHKDRTVKLAEQYKERLNLNIIEQSFPKYVEYKDEDKKLNNNGIIDIESINGEEKIKVAGFAIARKLGMDLALVSGAKYISYADVDIFGPKYIKVILDELKKGENGKKCFKDMKTHKIYDKVIDPDTGKQRILLEDEIKGLSNTHDNYYKFNRIIRSLKNNLLPQKKKIRPGWFATDAGLYAKIGGMKISDNADFIYPNEIFKATGQEPGFINKDFAMICHERVQTPRIKTGVGSNTENLSNIYRKFKNSNDGNYEVINPIWIEIYYSMEKNNFSIDDVLKRFDLLGNIDGKEGELSIFLQELKNFNWDKDGDLLNYIEMISLKHNKLSNIEVFGKIKIKDAIEDLNKFTKENNINT